MPMPDFELRELSGNSCESRAATPLSLRAYLAKSELRVVALTEAARRRHDIALDDHAWLLAQVEFIVDTIGAENLELTEDLRSDLLQLLLSIANLNEEVRRQKARAV